MDMPNDKAKQIAAELGELYENIVDDLDLEEVEPHFRLEIKSLRRMLENGGRGLVSAEKLDALEKAVDDFAAIYRAEKAEAEKMPLSRHEVERVKKLFADAEDDYTPLDDERAAH
jgi:hypothetical protein